MLSVLYGSLQDKHVAETNVQGANWVGWDICLGPALGQRFFVECVATSCIIATAHSSIIVVLVAQVQY